MSAHNPGDGPALDAPSAPGVKGVITLFYYDDLPGAIAFYDRVMRLQKVMQADWCELFELRPGAYLGLVDGASGSQKPIAGLNKGAVISLEVEDLDLCLARMTALGAVLPGVRLERGCAGRTLEFSVQDPGGYRLEFFRWIEPPDGVQPQARRDG